MPKTRKKQRMEGSKANAKPRLTSEKQKTAGRKDANITKCQKLRDLKFTLHRSAHHALLGLKYGAPVVSNDALIARQ
jgi:hypothetical protein